MHSSLAGVTFIFTQSMKPSYRKSLELSSISTGVREIEEMEKNEVTKLTIPHSLTLRLNKQIQHLAKLKPQYKILKQEYGKI